MPERASVFERTQLGVEVTPGVAVPANKRLQSIGIEPSISSTDEMYRPQGNKFATVQSHNQEFTTANLTGKPTYDEIPYALASVMGTPTITTPGAAINAREHAFTINPSDTDTPATYTVESGSSVRASRFTNGIVQSLNINISRTALDMTGTMIGQLYEDGVTLTADPETIPLIPVLPSQVSVYMDTTFAGLGTTKLLRVSQANIAIPTRANPVWALDAAQGSYAATVKTAAPITLELTLEADAAGMGLLAVLRNGSTRFIRVEAEGADIEATFPYLMRFDIAGKVSAIGSFSDRDGVYEIGFTFEVVDDAASGAAFDALVRNTLTAL